MLVVYIYGVCLTNHVQCTWRNVFYAALMDNSVPGKHPYL